MTPMKHKMIPRFLYFPEDLYRQFKAVAAKQGRSMSAIVRDLVTAYIIKHEK